MYGFLRQPKWIALTVLLVFVVPISALASHWQFNRWEERKAVNALIAANASGPPAPLSTVAAAGRPVDPQDEWRPITATGTYDAAGQVLWRRQPLDGRNGFIVVTPLVTPTGVLVVQRGWVVADSAAATAPDVAPPPSGTVTITGRLHPASARDEAQPADLPTGQVNWIDPRAIAGGRAWYQATVELTSSAPPQADGLTGLPLPELSEGPHLSYVGQWILIGLASVVIWVIVVRREAAHRRDEARTGAPAGGDPDPSHDPAPDTSAAEH